VQSDRVVQLSKTSCQYRINAVHQPTRPDREQPVEAPRLAIPVPYLDTLFTQVAIGELREGSSRIMQVAGKLHTNSVSRVHMRFIEDVLVFRLMNRLRRYSRR